jgi:hypothetical protein
MNKLLGQNWISFLREAEGVDGGGASDGGASGTDAGDGVAAVVAGDDAAAPATTLLTEAGKPAEVAPAEAEAAPPEAPAAFDAAAATLPEGVLLDAEISKSFSEILGNAELSPQERGQQLLDLHTKALGDLQKSATDAMNAANLESWKKTNDAWRDEIKSLPEFKTDPDAEVGKIMQALVSVGADEKFFAAVDLTGAGNNPAIMQVLHRLAQPFVEGGAVSGNGKAVSAKRLGDNIYTSTTKP